MNVFAKVGPTRFAIGRGRLFHTYISRNFAFFVVNLFPFLDSSDLKSQFGDFQIQRTQSSHSLLLSSLFCLFTAFNNQSSIDVKRIRLTEPGSTTILFPLQRRGARLPS